MLLSKNDIIEKYGVSNEKIKRYTKKGLLHPIQEGKKNFYEEDEVNSIFKKSDPTEDLKALLLEHYGYEPYIFKGEYVSNKDPIKLICNRCNNEIHISPGNMKNNIRLNRNPPCKYCGAKDSVKDQKLDFEKELYKLDKNYEILSPYVNESTKIKIKCLICNTEHEVRPGNLLYSLRHDKVRYCPTCNKMKRDTRSYEERLKEINDRIIPLEEYKGRKVNILHRCLDCGNEWECSPNNRLAGEGCPKCANKITQSIQEKELIDFLNELNLKDIRIKDRTILDGKEIDILSMDNKVGFEMNGNYWHSEKYKGKKYHLDKTILSESKGIRLIQIMDDEWMNKKDIVKSKICHILNINRNLTKIYARKCFIKEITAKEKKDFLNKNHIQGSDSSCINLGLFTKDNNTLVSVMTFCKPRKSLGQSSNKYDYELSRFASDINYVVVGGFSKLFSFFKNNYDWKKIITYADRRWSQGNVYLKNGWIHTHDSKPNYWYVDKNLKTRHHRYSFRKQVLKDKFPNIYDDNLTEFEIMDKTKYFRVWDCGNMVFEYVK